MVYIVQEQFRVKIHVNETYDLILVSVKNIRKRWRLQEAVSPTCGSPGEGMLITINSSHFTVEGKISRIKF